MNEIFEIVVKYKEDIFGLENQAEIACCISIFYLKM